MPLRYIGAGMIFLSCGVCGFLMAANHRREEYTLSQLLRLLDAIQSELEYRLTPLPQIFANVAQSVNGCLKKVFLLLSKELENQILPDASACMQTALAAVSDIPPSTQRALSELGNSLGKFDLQGQLNEISAVKAQCAEHLSQLRENMDVRLRSYRTMGLCIGAGLAILFL